MPSDYTDNRCLDGRRPEMRYSPRSRCRNLQDGCQLTTSTPRSSSSFDSKLRQFLLSFCFKTWKRLNFGNGDDALSLSFNAGLEIDHRRHIARSNWSGHVGPSFYLYRGALYFHHRLYGATNVQVYFYFRKYPKDRMILRCIVPFIWYVRSCDDGPVFTNAIGRWIRFIWLSQSMSCGIILSSRSEIIKLSFL